MADTLDLQSEDFMTLLTDALRAGPGSPEWSQAVKQLRSSEQNVDEYTLLTTAREHLESGKDYRSIRAGIGFTRKVMERVEREGVPRTHSTAGIIALLAGLVVVGVIVIVAVMLYKGPVPSPGRGGGNELATMIFGNRVAAVSFVARAGEAAPSNGWVKFGDLPLTVVNGQLRPATRPTPGAATGYRAGGWVMSDPISPDQAIEIDATLQLAKAGDDGIAQLFVSEEPITDINAAGGHALVWQLKGNESRAFLPDGKNASSSEKFTDQRELNVRLRLNKDSSLITVGDKNLYGGPNGLAIDKPRYVGVRFLRRGGEEWDQLSVRSLVVQKP